MKKIGVLTSGGDCPGLNNAIKWVVKTALDHGLKESRNSDYEVWGIFNGFAGLMHVDPTDAASINQHMTLLTAEKVRSWDRTGGTNLGTSRESPYNHGKDESDAMIEKIKALGFHALVIIGGNGSLSVAHRLSQKGVNVIGIPKTIDRDLFGTEYSLGFATAVEVITEEIDRLRTTAGSHSRIFVVETMGRNAGWLALEGGKSAGAYVILVPEHDFSMDRVCELISQGKQHGMRYEIVVVAEGAKPQGGDLVTSGKTDAFGRHVLGGIGASLAQEIESRTGHEARHVVLSHLQRGGQPCAYDRLMGRMFGIAAVDLICQENFGTMVALRHGEITSAPLEMVHNKERLVDVTKEYDTKRLNGPRTILGGRKNKE